MPLLLILIDLVITTSLLRSVDLLAIQHAETFVEELAVALTWRIAKLLDAAPLEETALLAVISPIVVVVELELEVFQTAVDLKLSKCTAPRYNSGRHCIGLRHTH